MNPSESTDRTSGSLRISQERGPIDAGFVQSLGVQSEDKGKYDNVQKLREQQVTKRKMQLAVSMFSVHTEKHRPRMHESDLLLEAAANLAK